MLNWKPNWHETKQHFSDWWNHEGFVLTVGTHPLDTPREALAELPAPGLVEAYEDGPARARRNHAWLAGQQFPGDSLPISSTDIGPGSLALALGSAPGFSRETVWFEPCWQEVADPQGLPPLTFDPESHWWKVTEATCHAAMELGRGKYLVGCPDLVENLDIVSALRDPQTLMMDMIQHPEWVEEKVWEVNQAFFAAYQRIYDIIKLPDGSSCFGAFNLWGPGKTAKVQCDAAAMFSPAMFRQFVVPALTAQCEWLDHSMFHLDGTQCLDKLEMLLAIDALDAVEWTPQAGIEGGGDPRWFDVYRRILAAGKSAQAIGVTLGQLKPLLDAVGPKGIYIMMWPQSLAEVEQALNIAAAYR
jgi:hypothetical protein